MAGKLYDELIKSITGYISLGVPVKYICDAHCISEPTYYGWYNRGEEIENGAENVDDKDTLKHKFFKSVKEAKGKRIARRMQHIEKAATDGVWTAAAWMLEREDPENFGNKQKLEHLGGLEITINKIKK